MNKLDPRVIRTRQMLRDALITLILQKGYDPITIQDITDQAGLRRATFYLHYKDKEELLLTTLGETFDDLEKSMHDAPGRLQPLTYDTEYSFHLIIFKHAQEHANMYRAILAGNGASTILRYVREYLVADIREHCVEALPVVQFTVPIEVLANYLASIKVNMALWWLEAGMPYPVEQMAEMCTQLTLKGVSEIVIPGVPVQS